MLDIPPPAHTPHTWRDFFIHIATIVLGLVIAIGLEQTVEHFQHLHQARHARQMLAQELDQNRKALQESFLLFNLHEGYLFSDLPVIARARTHTLKPDDHLVLWRPRPGFIDTAWQTIRENPDSSFLTYDELQRYSYIYAVQDRSNTMQTNSADALMLAATVIYHSAADRFNYAQAARIAPRGADYGGHNLALARASMEDQAPGPDKLNRLTPAQLDRLEQAIQEGIFADDSLISRCTILQRDYAQFPNSSRVANPFALLPGAPSVPPAAPSMTDLSS